MTLHFDVLSYLNNSPLRLIFRLNTPWTPMVNYVVLHWRVPISVLKSPQPGGLNFGGQPMCLLPCAFTFPFLKSLLHLMLSLFLLTSFVIFAKSCDLFVS